MREETIRAAATVALDRRDFDRAESDLSFKLLRKLRSLLLNKSGRGCSGLVVLGVGGNTMVAFPKKLDESRGLVSEEAMATTTVSMLFTGPVPYLLQRLASVFG